ncbi:MAG: alpha/beta fold hydrolase [Sandaracinaceae bacterium]
MRTVPERLYPFAGQTISLPGRLRLHYLDEGEGETLLMLHGNPTWSFYYRNLVLGLRDRYRCVVPDHMGMGRSDRPDDDAYRYTLQRRVDDLEALVERAAIQLPLTLIAHDWGGMIGMAWAARDPTRVRRLVLMNTAAFRLPDGTPFPWTLRLTRTGLGALLVLRANAFARGAARFCVTRPMPRDVRRAYLAPYDSPRRRLATLRFVEDVPLGPEDPAYGLVRQTEERLARFGSTPTLLLWGERDFVFGQAFLERWIELLPHAEVERYPDAGHYVLEDRGPDALARIERFLAESAPREPAA